MLEISKFSPDEIDETIEALDHLQRLISPILRSINCDGMGEEDVQQFTRHIMIAKHAVIMMGNFMEAQMGGHHEQT